MSSERTCETCRRYSGNNGGRACKRFRCGPELPDWKPRRMRQCACGCGREIAKGDCYIKVRGLPPKPRYYATPQCYENRHAKSASKAPDASGQLDREPEKKSVEWPCSITRVYQLTSGHTFVEVASYERLPPEIDSHKLGRLVVEVETEVPDES